MAEAHRDEWFLVASDEKLSIRIKDQVTLGEDQSGNLTLESRHENERWITLSIDPKGELVVSGLHEGRQIERPGGRTSREPGAVLESGMCLILGENQVCLSQRLSREKLTQEWLIVPARDSTGELSPCMEPPLEQLTEDTEDKASNAAEMLENVTPTTSSDERHLERSESDQCSSANEAELSETANVVSLAVNRRDAPGTDEAIGSNRTDGAETKGAAPADDAPGAVGIAPAQRRRSFAPNALALSVSLANRELKQGRVMRDQHVKAAPEIETHASAKASQDSARASLASERAELEASNSVVTVSQSNTRPDPVKSVDAAAVGGIERLPRRRFSARTALAASIALTVGGYWVINERASSGAVFQQQSTGVIAGVASRPGAASAPTLIGAVNTGEVESGVGAIAVGVHSGITTVPGLDAARRSLTERFAEGVQDRPVRRGPAAGAWPDPGGASAQDTETIATVSRVEQFSGVIREAESLIAQGYINWPERSAVAILGSVLAADPSHPQAGALLNEATARYLKEAEKAYADGFHQAAIDMLVQAQGFHPTYRDIDRLRVLWALD